MTISGFSAILKDISSKPSNLQTNARASLILNNGETYLLRTANIDLKIIGWTEENPIIRIKYDHNGLKDLYLDVNAIAGIKIE